MRIKAVPGDFAVTERADLALSPSGPWAVYRVDKVGMTSLQVQMRMAEQLGLPRDKVVFPALKDRQSIATQFACLPTGQSERIEGAGYGAQRIGYRSRPLGPADLRGNAFSIIVRDLSEQGASDLRRGLLRLATSGLPNYFDEQRMGSYAPRWGYIGKAILQRDAESALRAYLARPFLGDPRRVRAFKQEAQSLWPDWRAMMAAAPRPSNFRSVLTYLIDHPLGYRRALNLIPQRVLSIYLAAYQSYLWNRIVGAYLGQAYADYGTRTALLVVAERSLPVHADLAPDLEASLAAEQIALPNHRATYRSSTLRGIVSDTLRDEGLGLPDLKARILQRAYLPSGQRSVLLVPEELDVSDPAPDDRSGQCMLRVRFSLPRGSYATLVLNAAGALLDEPLEQRG